MRKVPFASAATFAGINVVIYGDTEIGDGALVLAKRPRALSILS